LARNGSQFEPVAALPLQRADSRGVKNPLKWLSLHLQGLLGSPAGSPSYLRLCGPVNHFNRKSLKYFIHHACCFVGETLSFAIA